MLHNFFAEMHIGVTMFFVLSGLLLTLRYYENDFSKPNQFYNYLINRFARIYPVYFIILSINFIYYNQSDYFAHTVLKNGWLYYLGSVTLLRGFFADFYDAFVSQSWSLTVEECFYLLCPLILLLVKKRRLSLVWLTAGLILTGSALVLISHGNAVWGFFRDFRFMFNFTFFGRCIEFFTGMGAAIIFRNMSTVKRNFPVFTLMGFLMIASWVFMLSVLHTDQHYGDYFPAGIFINNMLLPASGIAVFYWGLLTEQSWCKKILQSRFFVLLGKSSYCFYLLHLFIFAELFMKYVSGNPLLLFVWINVLSIAFYTFVEHPLKQPSEKKIKEKY